jgi:hypothetical protein
MNEENKPKQNAATKRTSINSTVHPVHFEEQSGIQFERMAFAFLYKAEEWDSLIWLGQTGSDGGRDIWGMKGKDSYCYQCANYRKLVLKKITKDIDKLLKEKCIPTYFTIICGGTVSVKQREQIQAHAAAAGFHNTAVWSGVEFEERMRKHAPDILRRFVNGEEFPEFPEKLTSVTNRKLSTAGVTLGLLAKYRSQKKLPELVDLLHDTIAIDDFAEQYGESIEELIFTDTFLIEYIASNAPETLIDFTAKYRPSRLNQGDHLYQILKGLLSDKSNPIYSEIKKYRTEDTKENFLHDYWHIEFDEFKYSNKKSYHTSRPIIKWLAGVIASYPHGLKEEIRYFLNHFGNRNDDASNKRIYTEEEIDLELAYDPLYNAIQLFRIILVEVAFNDIRATYLIDRILLLLFSAFEYVLEETDLRSQDVALNNSSVTVNEFLLKYIFQGYLSLFILLRTVAEERKYELQAKNVKENSLWIIKQVFSKVDKLVGSDAISDDSKFYYIENLVELYFKLPIYFKNFKKENIQSIGEAILWQLQHSMTTSPFGKPSEFQNIFKKVCERHEFYRHNSQQNISRAKRFYEYLLPFTEGLEYRIADI